MKYFILLLNILGIIYYTSGIELRDPTNPCATGPIFWCQNIDSAIKCNALDHCIQTVWSKSSMLEDSSCSSCANDIKELRNLYKPIDNLEDDLDIARSSQSLMKIVSQLSARSTSGRTDEQKLQDIESISSLLQNSAVNDFNVCKILGLCSIEENRKSSEDIEVVFESENIILHFPTQNIEFDRLNNEQIFNIDELSTDKCTNCTAATFLFKKYVDTDSKENVLQRILNVCNELSSFSDLCTFVITKNYDQIYEHMTLEFDPFTACNISGMCPDDYHNLLNHMTDAKDLIELPHSDTLPCTLCQQYIENLKRMLTVNTTEEEFHQVLISACDQLGNKDLLRDCQQIVNDYHTTIYIYVTQELEPLNICEVIDICPKSTALLSNDNVAYTNRLVPVINDYEKKGIRALIPKPISDVDDNLNSLSFCPVCKLVFRELKKVLQDPEDEKKVAEELSKVCERMPKSLVSDCDHFLDEYSSVIMGIVAQEMDPLLVCPALKVCPYSQNERQRCDECRFVMQDLMERLNGPYLLNDINSTLSSIAKADAGVRDLSVVSDLRILHQQEISEMFTAAFNEDESCVFLEYCDAQYVVNNPFSVTLDTDLATTDDTSNNICAMLVIALEDKFNSNATQGQIENDISSFCSLLKSDEVREDCENVAEEYAMKFDVLMRNNVSVDDLCWALNYNQIDENVPSKNGECRVCELVNDIIRNVVGSVDAVINSSTIEEAKNACKFMAGSAKNVCDKIVNEILPFAEGMKFNIPEWKVCSKLEMCPKSELEDEFLCGTEDNWCKSLDNAFMCDRLSYCSKNAWKNWKPQS